MGDDGAKALAAKLKKRTNTTEDSITLCLQNCFDINDKNQNDLKSYYLNIGSNF